MPEQNADGPGIAAALRQELNDDDNLEGLVGMDDEPDEAQI